MGNLTSDIRETKETCIKCSGKLIVRNHKRITTKQEKQPYYFSQWYRCLLCKTPDAKAKINPPIKAKILFVFEFFDFV